MIKAKKYDKQKAHEYYMKHRKLKGKKGKVKNRAGKVSERKKKHKQKIAIPKNLATLTKSTGGKATTIKYDEYKRRFDEIKQRAVNLSPEKKKALKKALNDIKALKKLNKGLGK